MKQQTVTDNNHKLPTDVIKQLNEREYQQKSLRKT